MSTLTTFRWEFRQQQLVLRTYAEAELTPLDRSIEHRFMMTIYLVRDEINRGLSIIDPEVRKGTRIYVDSFMDYEECRLIANLASYAAATRAYRVIIGVLGENIDTVEKFGDEWLTETIKEMLS